MTVAITRTELDAAGLRVAAAPRADTGAQDRPLALHRSARRDRAGVRRAVARTHGGQAVGAAELRARLGASAPSRAGCRCPGSTQKNYSELVAAAIPEHARGKPIELWWQDEARVGQQGSLTYVWAEKGTRPRAPREQRYEWVYLFGAVCPARGIGAALVLPEINTEAMNLHLAEVSRCVAPGVHAVVNLDGAGWRQIGGRLRVPDNISLLPLPRYSPELNQVENVWEFLRANFLSRRVWENYEAIVDACCDAWNKLMRMPEKIASIAARPWAKIKV